MRTRASGRPRQGMDLALALLVVVSSFGLGLVPGSQAQESAPANDDLAQAAPFTGFECDGTVCTISLSSSTLGATLEEGEAQACPLGGTLWYKVDAGSLGPTEVLRATVTVTAQFATVVAGYEGDGLSFEGLAALGCVNGEAPDGGPVETSLVVQATGPGPLWIQLGGAVVEGVAESGVVDLQVTSEAVVVPQLLTITPDAPTLRVNEKGAFRAEVGDVWLDGVSWDFGDGQNATGFDVLHRWTAPGVYEVEATGDLAGDDETAPPQDNTTVTIVTAALTSAFDIEWAPIFDDSLEVAIISRDLLVIERGGPLADPVRIPLGTALSFSEQAFGGSGSLSFAWSLGDGTTSTEETVVHTFGAIGSYPVSLTVRDGAGARSATHVLTRTVHVYLEAPIAGHVEPGGNVTLDVPGHLSIVCEVGVDGLAADFDGRVTVAAQPTGLGDGSGEFTAGLGVLFVSIEGGPESGQCERVTLTFSYTDARLAAAGASEGLLGFHYWNGEAWLALSAPATFPGATPDRDLRTFAASLDAASNRAVLVTNHTSAFALGGPAAGGAGGGGGGGGGVGGTGGDGATPAPAPSDPLAPTESDPAADDASAPAADGADSGAGQGSAGAGIGTSSAGAQGGPAFVDVRRPDGAPIARSPGATLDGVVEVFARNAPPAGSRLVLVAEDGRESELARDAQSASWDTGQSGNGRYTVELRDGDGVVLASTSYIVYNGRADLEDVAGALLLGAGVMVGGFLLSAFLNAVREGATAVAEDKFRERTKRQRLTAWLGRIPSVPSLLIGVPVFIVFFALDGLESLDWAAYLDRLPYVAGAATFVFALAYSLEILLNVASGARSRFQLLLSGFIALASSTLLFRVAFGYPGFVEEDEVEGGLPKRVEGLRSVALLLVILAIAAPFFLVLTMASFKLGEIGMTIVMSLLATSSLPFRPVPGANIWKWSKPLSLLLVAATFGLFVAFELGLVPLVAIAWSGLAGLAGFVAIYVWLRSRPAPATGATADEPVGGTMPEASPQTDPQTDLPADPQADALVGPLAT